MDWKSYIDGIEFCGLRPEDRGIMLVTGHEDGHIMSTADLKITRLPSHDAEMKERLAEVCLIPRMSTFAIGSIINLAVSEMAPDQAFVNVGVWHGFSFMAGLAGHPEKRCVGIDNFSEFGGPRERFHKFFMRYKSGNHSFFEMDYRDYFCNQHSGPIGFYIYDGNHSLEDQCEGLRIAEPFLAKGCLILIDDINTEGPIEGTKAFLEQSKEQYTAHNNHPTFWNGIALLQKTS